VLVILTASCPITVFFPTLLCPLQLSLAAVLNINFVFRCIGIMKTVCSFSFQVLFVYPPEKQLPLKDKDLLSFCFPGGLEVRCMHYELLISLTRFMPLLLLSTSSPPLLSILFSDKY